MNSRQRLVRFSLRWHRRLSWLGGLAVIIWAVSGISHPLMSWTGPKAAAFFPPKVELSDEDLRGLQTAAVALVGANSAVTKIVQYRDRRLLQITQDVEQARQYFDLQQGRWLEQHDPEQAKWLASYYTGRPKFDITSIEFMTDFSADYPSVNRLLPVYRVHFAGEDQLQAYVHTETSALASLNDAQKRRLQQVFQQLHTWSFLDVAGTGRVILIGLMMLCLFLMASAGIGLLIGIKQRRIAKASRRWHRVLAYGIWVPLMGWSFSGFYHLLQADLVKPVSGMHLDNPIALPQWDLGESAVSELLARPMEVPLRSVSIVGGSGGEALLRLGLGSGAQHGDADKTPSRAARYSGIPTEQAAIYLNMTSGELVDIDDKHRARRLALNFTGLGEEDIESVSIIQRFGNGYDFRNKRLPVWRVVFRDEDHRHLYIDPTTGVLVDQNRLIDRRESRVFSILHKWNPLAVIGRQNRDIVVVVTLLIALGFTVLGYMMLFRKRTR